MNLRDTKKKEVIKVFFASAFGLGLLPIAPGTCGALLGVAGHVLIVQLLPTDSQLLALSFFFVIVCIIHFLLSPWAVEYWRSKDPKNFVLDEVAGYLVVPILFRDSSPWQVMFWGFTLFRIFDIIKLPGARQIDKNMSGSWGILLDDIVSGCYATVALYLFRFVSSSFRM